MQGGSTSGDFRAWTCLIPVRVLELRVSVWKSIWVLMPCLRLSAPRFPNMPAVAFLLFYVLLYILEIVPLWAINLGLSYGPSINYLRGFYSLAVLVEKVKSGFADKQERDVQTAQSLKSPSCRRSDQNPRPAR